MRKQQTELDEQSIDIINAVKAESARAGMTGKVLANGIGRDRNYIYERFRYEKPFDTDDLSAIAKCIGITRRFDFSIRANRFDDSQARDRRLNFPNKKAAAGTAARHIERIFNVSDNYNTIRF
jgi:hypothetical protein